MTAWGKATNSAQDEAGAQLGTKTRKVQGGVKDGSQDFGGVEILHQGEGENAKHGWRGKKDFTQERLKGGQEGSWRQKKKRMRKKT